MAYLEKQQQQHSPYGNATYTPLGYVLEDENEDNISEILGMPLDVMMDKEELELLQRRLNTLASEWGQTLPRWIGVMQLRVKRLIAELEHEENLEKQILEKFLVAAEKLKNHRANNKRRI